MIPGGIHIHDFVCDGRIAGGYSMFVACLYFLPAVLCSQGVGSKSP